MVSYEDRCLAVTKYLNQTTAWELEERPYAVGREIVDLLDGLETENAPRD